MFSKEQLTSRQRDVLNFVEKFRRTESNSPTYREIAEHFGFKSTKAVTDHICALEKKGYIRRNNGRSRGIELLLAEDKQMGNALSVPILGVIPAGEPETKDEQTMGMLTVDPMILGKSAKNCLFALQVRGESMTGRGIYEGDWIVADANISPKEGDVVVALMDGKNTLKTLARKKNAYYLQAENPEFPDFIPLKEIVIQGVVRAVIRAMGGL